MPASSRHLAAVWFADVVGYTRLSSEDEDAALALVHLFQELTREEIDRHEGRLVKFMGDGALAAFSSTDAAVRCALALRARFSAAEEGTFGGELRIGMHVGEVIRSAEGDLYGDGINTAARLQAEAEPGQIVVSQDVWRQLRPRPEYRFVSLGERSLKGITGRVWVFSVSTADAPPFEDTSTSTRKAPGPSVTPRRFARVLRATAVYLAISVLVLEGVGLLRSRLGLPGWVFPAAVVLLVVGLASIAMTSWLHSRPVWDRQVAPSPEPWDLDLDSLSESLARRRLPELTWPRAIAGGLVAFSLLFGLAGAYVYLSQRSPRIFAPNQAYAAPGPGLAIFPFDATGEDRDLWGEGMLDLLAINLDGVAGIRVIDPRVVLSRWPEPDSQVNTQAALEIARNVGARYALTGTITTSEQRVRLSARVFDLVSDEILDTISVQGPPDSVAALVDRLGLAVLEAGLLPAERDIPPLRLRSLSTPSLSALQAFLIGERFFRRSRWEEARLEFERAVNLDPTFALALYRLSLTEAWSSLPHQPRPDPYGSRAVRFADRLSERDALLVRGYQLLNERSPSAIDTLERLTARYPDDVEGWFLLGDADYHLGRSGASENRLFRRAFGKTLDLDPGFGPAYLHLIEDALANEDTANARELFTAYRRVDPGSPLLLGFDWAAALARRNDAAESTSGPAEQSEPVSAPTARTSPQRTEASPPVARRADAEPQREQPRAPDPEEAERARWQPRVDSARIALAALRSATRTDAAGRAEGEAWERRAEEAVRSGSYTQALGFWARAGEVYRRPPPPSPRAEPKRTPPPAPAPVTLAPEAIAQQVLAELRRAIEREDIDALRSVWESLSQGEQERFRASFALMRDLRVRFDVRSVQRTDDGIALSVQTTYEFFNESTRQPDRQAFSQVFQLAQRGGRWVIVGSR